VPYCTVTVTDEFENKIVHKKTKMLRLNLSTKFRRYEQISVVGLQLHALVSSECRTLGI